MKLSRLRSELQEASQNENTVYYWKDLLVVGGTIPIRMLCGCLLDGNSIYQEDTKGFIVCPLHNQRRMGWRVPSHAHKWGSLSDLEFQNLTIFGELPVKPKQRVVVSCMPDLRPHIYEGMMDEIAIQAIARAHRPVERNEHNGSSHRAPEISAEYCDLATDSGHSSANGLGG